MNVNRCHAIRQGIHAKLITRQPRHHHKSNNQSFQPKHAARNWVGFIFQPSDCNWHTRKPIVETVLRRSSSVLRIVSGPHRDKQTTQSVPATNQPTGERERKKHENKSLNHTNPISRNVPAPYSRGRKI